MAKYAIFFSYTPDAWRSVRDDLLTAWPPVRRLVEAVGGTVDCFY